VGKKSRKTEELVSIKEQLDSWETRFARLCEEARNEGLSVVCALTTVDPIDCTEGLRVVWDGSLMACMGALDVARGSLPDIVAGEETSIG
jgi:hypothetical protein